MRYVVVLTIATGVGLAQPTVDPSAALVSDFQNRVAEYIKLRKQAAGPLERLKPTNAAEKITAHEETLAERIRNARSGVKPGAIFAPPIAAEFRRLIAQVLNSPEGPKIRKSLRDAEPVQVKLVVNSDYPRSSPFPATPPTLLLNLPKLPKELEYRVIGHALILRDADANLIVDFIPNAIP